ncbi:MAG: class I SAM-dependent methyltransferase [Acidobacteriota bacterium]|nr:class I SAM-dependent methyltransferase [Acidobacteriota bacterium]
MPALGTAVVDGRGFRRARRGHPWLHRENVVEIDAAPGSIVRVFDRAGTFACWAACSPASRIPLRRVSRADVPPDAAFWRERLSRCAERRDPLPRQGSRRLVNADAEGLPGLTVDWYAGHVVYQATTAWADRAAPELLPVLAERLGAISVLARNDVPVRKLEDLPLEVIDLIGATPGEIVVENAGVLRDVDPRRGHKTGLYLDQQVNQARAAGWLHGEVLDLFSGEGGFSVPLAVAGRRVLAADQSGAGLTRARRAAERAGVAGRIEWFEGNAFDLLARLEGEGRRFDAVIADPPPFARRRDKARPATKAYKDVHRRALRLVKEGGRMLSFCCSFHIDAQSFEEAARAGAEEAGRLCRVIERPGAAPDHPERLELPESRYLKGLLIEIEAEEAGGRGGGSC